MMALCGACISNPYTPYVRETDAAVNFGLQKIAPERDTPPVSFNEATEKLVKYMTGQLNNVTTNKTIYIIKAKNLDESGKSDIWIFGVKFDTRAELISIDKNGQKTAPWNAPLPAEEIQLTTIISPGTLFSRHRLEIIGTSLLPAAGQRDLELKNGIYTLTIYSGNIKRTLMFNATTGALIG
jgi:hypothetical protein